MTTFTVIWMGKLVSEEYLISCARLQRIFISSFLHFVRTYNWNIINTKMKAWGKSLNHAFSRCAKKQYVLRRKKKSKIYDILILLYQYNSRDSTKKMYVKKNSNRKHENSYKLEGAISRLLLDISFVYRDNTNKIMVWT